MFVVLQGFYHEERVSISVFNTRFRNKYTDFLQKQHNRSNPFNHAYLAKQESLDVI